jgi:TRAP-type C4-dicarboxylate transport system permease small subunit
MRQQNSAAGQTIPDKIDRMLRRAVDTLLVALFAVMLGLSAIQIVLRYVLGTGMPWAEVASRNLVLWVGLLGAVLATAHTKHFQLDVLTRFLNEQLKRWFDVFAESFGAIVCVCGFSFSCFCSCCSSHICRN